MLRRSRTYPLIMQDTNVLLRTQQTVNTGFETNRFLRCLIHSRNSGRIYCLQIFPLTAVYQFYNQWLEENAYVPLLGCHHFQGDALMMLPSNSVVTDTNRDSLEHVSEFPVIDDINIKEPEKIEGKMVQMSDTYVEIQLMNF